MSVTPERIEEIKQIVATCDIWKFSEAEQTEIVDDLRTALEEAQQQCQVERNVAAGYHRELVEAKQTIAQQGKIIHGIDRDLTKLRLALIAIAGTDIIGSSAITMKAIAQEALRKGAKES